MQLVAKSAVQPWCSASTVPPGKSISDPALIRAASRGTYGVDRAKIEADLYRLFSGPPPEHEGDDLPPRRRDRGSGV